MKDYFTYGPGMGGFVCFFNLKISFGSTRNREKDKRKDYLISVMISFFIIAT